MFPNPKILYFFYCITILENHSFETRGYCCCRKLPNCTHLCPEICHPGQCPLPEKCGKKVIFPRLHDDCVVEIFVCQFIIHLGCCFATIGILLISIFIWIKVVVRCKCITLKKEWLCQDVQAAHRATGSDPKEVQKNQFGVGLLPCDSNCKSKLQMAESVLQQRNVKEIEVNRNNKKLSELISLLKQLSQKFLLIKHLRRRRSLAGRMHQSEGKGVNGVRISRRPQGCR